MSSLRKRGVRLKRFNSATTATTQSQLLPADVTDTLSPPPSPPSSTSQSELSTPPHSASASTSSDSPSPLTPSQPSRPPPQRLSSVSHIGSDVDGQWPDDTEVVERDEHISHSLTALSSLAPRLPTPLHVRLTAQLSVHWAQWMRLPLNVRCAVACVSLFYCLLFSLHTHVLLLLFYAALLFSLLSLRDQLTSLARQRGLLSVLPTTALPYVSEYNLLELSRILLSSTLTSDVLLLLCFQLSEAEQRVVLQRLPAPYSDWLMRRGVVNLLPVAIQQLLYPAPLSSQHPRSTATVIALADGEQTEAVEVRREERGEEVENDDMHEPGLLGEVRSIPSEVMERKYDDEASAAHIDSQLFNWPANYSHTAIRPQPPPVAASPGSILSITTIPFSRQSSLSSTLSPPSPAPSDDEVDPATVTLSSVIDRQLSSSLSALFRSWAKQSYTALYDATTELLPNVVSSSSSLHFFVPLAASIVGLHVVSSHGRVREVMRRSQPYVVDGVMCVSALLAAHHLYVLLVEGFNRRREERRLAQSGEVAVSRVDERGWGVRVWMLYVYRKCRGERGVFVSGVVMLCWLLYLSKARSRMWQWLERRELHRRGALAQLTNRLA